MLLTSKIEGAENTLFIEGLCFAMIQSARDVGLVIYSETMLA